MRTIEIAEDVLRDTVEEVARLTQTETECSES